MSKKNLLKLAHGHNTQMGLQSLQIGESARILLEVSSLEFPLWYCKKAEHYITIPHVGSLQAGLRINAFSEAEKCKSDARMTRRTGDVGLLLHVVLIALRCLSCKTCLTLHWPCMTLPWDVWVVKLAWPVLNSESCFYLRWRAPDGAEKKGWLQPEATFNPKKWRCL